MPITCALCDDHFSDLDTFKKHCLYHSFDNPLFCSKCNYTCCDSDLLEQHFSTKHNNSKRSFETLAKKYKPAELNHKSYATIVKTKPKEAVQLLLTDAGFEQSQDNFEIRETIKVTSNFSTLKNVEETIQPLQIDLEHGGSSHDDFKTKKFHLQDFKYISYPPSKFEKESKCRNHSIYNSATAEPPKYSSSKVNKKQVTCEVCNVCLNNLSDLIVHQQSHAVNQSYVCTCCSFIASSSKELKSHKKMHLQGVVYECHICDYYSNQKGTLNRHLRVHSKDRPFECELCDYSTRHQSTLDTHKKAHFDIRQYVCEQCNKIFLTKQNLKIHFLIHTRERPHTCEICNKTFIQLQHLNTHFKRLHSHYL